MNIFKIYNKYTLYIYIYIYFINFIKCLCILRYTIWKNQKSIYDTIHVLTMMQKTHKDQITLLQKKKKNKKKKKKIKSHTLSKAPFTCNCIDVADRWIWSISLLVGIGCVLFFDEPNWECTYQRGSALSSGLWIWKRYILWDLLIY